MPRFGQKMEYLQYLTAKRHIFYSFDTKDAGPFKAVSKEFGNDQTLLEIRSEITSSTYEEKVKNSS